MVAYSVLLLVFLPELPGPWRRLAILFAVMMVQYRAIATRYDKLAVSYHSWLVLAALLLWLPA